MAIEGNLQDMSLVDIIQLRCRDSESSAVLLTRGNQEGAIYFADGQVLHAIHGNDQGEEAFYRLLQWQDAHFVIKKGVESMDQSIHIPWRPLLVQTLQRIDEERSDTVDEHSDMADEGPLRELADRLDHVVAIFALDDDGVAVATLVESEAFDRQAALASLSDTFKRIVGTLSTMNAGAFEETITITSRYRFITRPVGDNRHCVQVVLDGNGNIGAARMHLAAYLATRGEGLSRIGGIIEALEQEKSESSRSYDSIER
jgi:hypothetical protein